LSGIILTEMIFMKLLKKSTIITTVKRQLFRTVHRKYR